MNIEPKTQNDRPKRHKPSLYPRVAVVGPPPWLIRQLARSKREKLLNDSAPLPREAQA